MLCACVYWLFARWNVLCERYGKDGNSMRNSISVFDSLNPKINPITSIWGFPTCSFSFPCPWHFRYFPLLRWNVQITWLKNLIPKRKTKILLPHYLWFFGWHMSISMFITSYHERIFLGLFYHSLCIIKAYFFMYSKHLFIYFHIIFTWLDDQNFLLTIGFKFSCCD